MLAAACLLLATVMALVLEALARAAVVRQRQVLANDSYVLLERGREVSEAVVVAVVEGRMRRPTKLVSDEMAGARRVRRLRFFHSPPDCPDDEIEWVDTIQTEFLLRKDGAVDHTHLSCPWHRLMIASLASAGSELSLGRALVLGHGCGALSSFLKEVLHADVTAVDQDDEVCELAKKFFADTTRVYVGDAAQFVLSIQSSERFDVVFIDLNAGAHGAVSAPPASVYAEGVVASLSRVSRMVLVNVLQGSQPGQDECRRIGSVFAGHFPTTRWLCSPLCSNRILVACRQDQARVSPHQQLNSRLEVWRKQSEAVAGALEGLEYGATVLTQERA